MNVIPFIEELSFNAWPSTQTLHYDGWLLRFSEGYTRRANSVNPIYGSSLDVRTKLRYCEQVYTRQRLDTIFKMSDAVLPENLDAVLDSEGYAREATTSVRVVSLRHRQVSAESIDAESKATAGTITLATKVTDDWLNCYYDLVSRDKVSLPIQKRMLGNILVPTCYVSLMDGDEPISLGIAVLERGYVGMYDIVTAASHRQRGFGTRLMLQLMAWGRTNGADYAYLQVMTDNAPALKLYHNLGFEEVYQYWYRVRARPG